MHLELAVLEAGIDTVRESPTDAGTVELIVARPAEDEREVLTEATLDRERGLVGDGWIDRDADPEGQLTLMNARAVGLLSPDRSRWPLAGDQLYVDLDLSSTNLPPGTRLAVGSAVVEITARPHRGCKKFAARFGLDALRFVNSEAGYALKLRGIYAKVIESGVVRPGDSIHRIAAPEAGLPPATASVGR